MTTTQDKEYAEMLEQGTHALEDYANTGSNLAKYEATDSFGVMAWILAPLYDPATGTIHGRKVA